MAQITSWFDKWTRKITQELLAQKQMGADTPASTIIKFINPERTKGQLPDGTIVNVVIRGTIVGTYAIGFKIGKGKYLCHNERIIATHVDGGQDRFIIFYEGSATGRAFLKKIGSPEDEFYEILKTDLQPIVPPFPAGGLVDVLNIDYVTISTDGKHIAVLRDSMGGVNGTIDGLTTVVETQKRLSAVIYENWFVEDGLVKSNNKIVLDPQVLNSSDYVPDHVYVPPAAGGSSGLFKPGLTSPPISPTFITPVSNFFFNQFRTAPGYWAESVNGELLHHINFSFSAQGSVKWIYDDGFNGLVVTGGSSDNPQQSNLFYFFGFWVGTTLNFASFNYSKQDYFALTDYTNEGFDVNIIPKATIWTALGNTFQEEYTFGQSGDFTYASNPGQAHLDPFTGVTNIYRGRVGIFAYGITATSSARYLTNELNLCVLTPNGSSFTISDIINSDSETPSAVQDVRYILSDALYRMSSPNSVFTDLPPIEAVYQGAEAGKVASVDVHNDTTVVVTAFSDSSTSLPATFYTYHYNRTSGLWSASSKTIVPASSESFSPTFKISGLPGLAQFKDR